MEHPTLTIKSELSTGAPGEDADRWNPLARAARTLLQDGTRIQAATHLYVADDATREISWWLGIVVEGESGRLMFFPGLTAPLDRMRFHAPRSAAVDRAFDVDHLTLEPGWRTWHATQRAPRGKNRGRSRRRDPPSQGGPRTWDLGDGNVLWFGMTIARDEALRRVKQTTIATAIAPPNREEAIARLQAFGRAVRGAQMAVIGKPSPPPFPRALCHFAFIVAPPSAPFYSGHERGFGGSLDGVLTAFPVAQGTRGHSLWAPAALSPRVRLQVISTWFPGEMASAVPAVFHGRPP